MHPGGYQRTITDRSAAKSRIADSPIAEVPRVLDLLFRVRPDRRFVNAVADISELSGGRKIDDVEIEFVNGAWDVRVAMSEGSPVSGAAHISRCIDDVVRAGRVQQRVDSAPLHQRSSTPSTLISRASVPGLFSTQRSSSTRPRKANRSTRPVPRARQKRRPCSLRKATTTSISPIRCAAARSRCSRSRSRSTLPAAPTPKR